MTLIEVLKLLSQHKIQISLDDNNPDQLKISAAKGAMTAEIMQLLKARKPELLAWAQQKAQEKQAAGQAIDKRPADTDIPLSFAQQRLWVVDQLAPGSVTYNVPAAVLLKGTLDIAVLNRVFEAVIERHEALRTVFHQEGGEVFQKILPNHSLTIEAESTDVSADDQKALIRIAADTLLTPFDLEAAPPLRVRLLKLQSDDAQDTHLLLINLHHIITDGWSNGVLLADIAAAYQAFAAGNQPAFEPIKIQYADYSWWQHEQLPADQLAAKTRYWQDKLKGVEVLELPADHPRQAQKSGRGSTFTFKLDAALKPKVNALAKQHGCTDFVVFLAAFQALLQRLSGQTDICVGSPIAGRNRPEIQQTMGFFVNTLALRVDHSSVSDFNHLIDICQQTLLEANDHQDVPFESVVESLNIARDMSTTPVFQVAISYQKQGLDTALTLGDLAIEPLQLETGTAKFDITLGVTENENGFDCSLEYDTDLYTESRIEAFADYFSTLLNAALAAPQTAIKDIPLLSKSQQQHLLEKAGESVEVPYQGSLAWQFEQWASKQPDALAVSFPGESLTYQALNEKASQLAHYLSAQGFAKGDILAVAMQRSCDMVALALAALKAGGAYLPIDPEYPEDRIRYMLEDADCKLAICLKTDLEHLQNLMALSLTEVSIQAIETVTGGLSEYATDWQSPQDCNQGEDLAYLMYTSGSTGQPKGVLVPQRGMTRLAIGTEVDFAQGKRVAFLGNVAFDASAWEIWGALLNGGSLIGINKDTLLDSQAFADTLKTEQVDIALLTVALFNVMASEDPTMFGGLQNLFVGGEAPDPAKIRAVMQSEAPPTKLFNAYGPTENAVATTYHQITEADLAGGSIPLGHSISNSFSYILDDNQQLVPPGVAGELCTSGIGLALGYLNKKDQTDAAFISNPFQGEQDKSALLYRTGDICRWNANGQIEILGRADDQIKLRGFRIELDEITHQLTQLPNIKDAVAVARQANGNTYIAAYLVTQESIDNHSSFLQGLKESLGDRIPKFMVPQAFTLMDALPQTANGKLDKKALPEPELQLAAEDAVAPRNDQEQAIADVWQEVLNLTEISVHDNFFDIGGHSLLATRAVARLRESLDVDLVLRDLFDNPTIAELALHIQILEGQSLNVPKLTAQVRPEQLPLSYAQQRMWFIDQLMPQSAVYNMPFAMRLRGNLHIDALQTAFNALVARHESLRTRIESAKGEAWQLIDSAESFECPVYTVNDDDQELILRATDFALAPFDLAKGPLFKAELIQQQSTGDWVLMMNMHHIISDGWSMEILIRDLFTLYQSEVHQLPHALPALSVQYPDYAIWQRDWLKGEVLEQQVDYWKAALAGVETLELPIDYSRPAALDNAGAQLRFDIPDNIAQGIRSLSNQHGTTLYMTLLAAFAVLMGKYANQKDVAIGSPMAGRSAADLENIIGLFVNTLVMRVQWDDTDNFTQLLEQVKQNTLAAYQHQDIAFEQLVDELGVSRSLSQTPLFQVMLILQTSAEAQNIDKLTGQFEDIQVESLTDTDTHATAKFDITLNIIDLGEGLSGAIEYRTSLFKPETIQRLADHFIGLLKAIVEQADQAIGKIALISDDEKAKQLDWQNGINATQKDYPHFDALHRIIEAQAAETPNAIALVDDNGTLSYEALNAQANQLAHHLIEQGLKPNQPVGVCLYRANSMSVALLAILKAGGAYVPFDPDFPIDRLAFMAEDTGIQILISDASVAPAQQLNIPHTVWMDDLANLIHGKPATTPDIAFANDALFNIIYTSGSTGNPKGVMVPHQGIINRLQWMQDAYPLTANDKILQKTPYSFDVSVWELFWPLMQGATLVFAKPDGHKDPAYLRDTISEKGITVLHFVPSMLGVFLQTDGIDALTSIRQVFCSGEALQLEHGRRFYQQLPNARLDNLYGPTEASIDVSYYACVAEETRRSIPIGKPIANTQLHILDDNLNLVPQGIAGELYIGGRGLALGYLNRDELTSTTFIDNPYKANGHPSSKLYKTGDVARLLDDGNIEYLGRTDHQIKIRGLRIELGEIESRLQNLAGIDEAIVTAQSPDGSKDNLQLVAYYLATSAPDTDEIKHSLNQQMPEYMVPTHYIQLDAWPLSANGKINRKALPAPDWQANKETYVAPATPTQQTLVEIWASLLPNTDAATLGINDNFFALGGHSLLATRLIAEIAQSFDLDISVRTIFEAPTIATLAEAIEQTHRLPQALPAVEPVNRDQALPLSFNQQRLWFIYKLAPDAASYNMPMALRLTGKLDIDALQNAFNKLIQRHEIFRTRIVEEGETLSLAVADSIELPIAVEASDKADEQAIINREAQAPFDLTTAPLLRVSIKQYADDEHLLLITMHHIISDAASLEVFVRELAALYLSPSAPLPPLQYQYADYAWWQQNVLAGDYLDQQITYWQQQLAGAPAQLALPTDKPRPPQLTQAGSTASFTLPDALVNQVREFALANGLTPFMVMLGAQQLLLGRISRQDDVCIGVPVAGRHHKGTENLIGFFVNALAVRTQFDDNPNVDTYFQRVKDNVLGAFAHQDAPFEQVVDQLDLPRTTSYNPLVQVGFNYFTQSGNAKSLATGDLTIDAIDHDVMDAKYDMIWSFQDDQSAIQATLEYNTDLFTEATVTQWFDLYQQLITNLIDNQQKPVKRLQLVDDKHLLDLVKAQQPDTERVQPLTPMQRDLYIDTLMEPDNKRDYLGWIQFTDQQVDVARLQQAIDILANHYAALRTRIVKVDKPYTEVAYAAVLDNSTEASRTQVEYIDWSDRSLDQDAFKQACFELQFKPYDLANESIWRIVVIQQTAETCAILTTAHHAAFDGVAMQVITKHYSRIYEALASGESAESLAATLPEDNFASYAFNQFENCDNEESLRFWQSKAQGVEALSGSMQAAKHGNQGQYFTREFKDTADHWQAIQAWCKDNNTNPMQYVKAIYALALQSQCYADNDFYFADIIAARPKGHVQEVGCYFEQRPSVFSQSVMSADNQFADLIEYLEQYRVDVRGNKRLSNAMQTQLFAQSDMHCLFNFYMMEKTLPFMGKAGYLSYLAPEMDNCVTLTAIVDDDSLLFSISYTDNVFTDDLFIERMLNLSQQILAGKTQLNELTLCLADEITPPAQATVDYSANAVIDLIHKQIEQTPLAIATSDGNSELTYAELNRQANHLAHKLINEFDVTPGNRIAICHSANTQFMVALLATLKAGACYIPVDVNYPAGRITHILEDSQTKLTLTEQCVAEKISGQSLLLDSWECPAEEANAPQVEIALDDPLYVIYTSGSTGLPKGAQLTQRGELNLIQWYNREFAINANDKVLIISATGFDLTQKNLLAPLCAGAQIVFPETSDYDPALILNTIAEQKISLINCAPSAFYPLAENHTDFAQLSTLRLVLFGGEPIRITALLPWLESADSKAQLINMYGPTECTDIASYYRIVEPGRYVDQPIPIGKANDNIQLHLLDSANRILPPGFAGELVITGEGVGDGYIGHASDKNDAFIDHPILGRAYKTGDIVKQDANGNYIFLNRKDHQVKLRGLRIELAEIEFALKRIDGVNDALAMVTDDKLIAYVLTDNGEAPALWREALSDTLTDYMVPQALAAVAQWPLTANGKIDRKALPTIAGGRSQEQVAPRNDTEAALLTIWQEVLGTQKIGVYDNFFELGGHSLLAARAVTRIREHFNQELALRDVFFSPTIAAIAELLNASEHNYSALPAIEPVDREPYQNHFPLSFAQQRLWLLEQIQTPSSMYNMPLALNLKGEVNTDLLEESLTALVSRHESLRTRLVEKDGIAYQSLMPIEEFTLERITQGDDENLDHKVAAYLQKPFKLAEEPLFKACIIDAQNGDTVLTLNMHHIITDGLSSNVLLADLAAILLANGDAAYLPPLKAQYIDYSLWQQEVLTDDVLDQQLGYWRQQLANPSVLDMPLDHPRQAGQSLEGQLVEFNVSDETTAALKRLAQNNQATLNMVLLAAYTLLLHRYTGQQDIAIGTPSANRPQAALEGIIGFFVNTLVVRNELDDDTSVQSLIAQVKQTLGDGLKHQDIPFERLLDALDIPRDLTHSPLFQAFFTLQTASDLASEQSFAIGDTQISAYEFAQAESFATSAKFELSLSLLDNNDALSGTFEYRTALFTSQTMQRFAKHFVLLLDALAKADASTAINQLTFIDGDEAQHQLEQTTEAPVDHSQHVLALFEQQAEQTPDAIASASYRAGDQLTYKALNEKANQLAHYLESTQGITTGSRIAILQQPGTNFIVSLLATLKLASSYIPLDPHHPDERLAFILDDANADLVLTHQALGKRVESTNIKTVDFDQIDEALTQQPANNPGHAINPTTPLYLIYTSGSTGKPKGVEVIHQGETNLIDWYNKAFNFNTDDKFLIISATGFDLTQKNFFAPITTGGELIFADTLYFDAEAIVDQIHQNKITTINCAPSALYALLKVAEASEFPYHKLASLKTVLLGGEPIQIDKIRPWLEKTEYKTELVNMYGPTECTDIASIYRIQKADDIDVAAIPIGRAIANTQLYILDAALNLLPAGAVGELYIGGIGLSNGYQNRPELNAESFIANPFGNGQLYKTGDLVRYTSSDCTDIGYIGRTDHQVKIRGLRIELGEIENRLRDFAEVAEVLVTAVKHPTTGEDHLCAYLVPAANHTLEANAIRNQLATRLPDYMVPGFWHVLDAFPLNANGKIDRKALPAPSFQQSKRTDLVAPRTSVEQTLAGIWQEVLALDEISIDDDFFAMGGHSLKAAEVVGQMRKAFTIDVALRDLFESTTIADQALLVEQKQQSTVVVPPITQADRDGTLPLSYAQQRLWFLAQMAPDSPAYNMPAAFKIRGNLNVEALAQAFAAIVKRHESLRTAFVAVEGEPQLEIKAQAEHSFTLHRETIDSESAMQAFVEADAIKPFDLTSAQLLRASLLELSFEPQAYVLVLNMHHIISDGWSVQVLMRELGALYMSYGQGLGDVLPPLDLQYTDYAAWQRDWLQGEVLDDQIGFWRDTLADAPTLLQLPLDRPRPEVQSFNGALVKSEVPAELANKLRALSRENGVTLFMTSLAAYQLLLHKYSQQDDICVGIPLAGRSIEGVNNLIGFFINALIIRTDFSANLSVSELLASIKNTALAAFAHEHVPIEMLLNELNIERNLQFTPVAQCAFNMMTASESALPEGFGDLMQGIDLELVETDSTVAKFDLQMNLLDTDNALTLSLEYNVDIFDESTINRFISHYLDVLNWLVDDSDKRINEIQVGQVALPEGYVKTIPLTAMQRDIYLGTLANPDTLENSVGYAWNAPIKLDEDLWYQALSEIASQYDSLRADALPNDIPWQDVAYLGVRDNHKIDFEVLDWQAEWQSGEMSEEQLKERIKDLVVKPYDLTKESGVTYRMIKIAEDHYWATVASHHLFMDGFGGAVHHELMAIRYEQLVKGEGQPLVLDDHLELFTHQTRNEFDTTDTLAYWKNQLSSCEGLQVQTGNKHLPNEKRLLSQPIPVEHYQQVKKYCRQFGITPPIYFKCLYAILIQQYTRAEGDFVVTEFNGGRNKTNQGTIGCFYHTQPFCFTADSLNNSVEDLFKGAKAQQKSSRRHLQLSNNKLRKLVPASSTYFSYNYLMLPHHRYMLGQYFTGERYTPNTYGMVDLRVQADGDELCLWLAYDSHVFDDKRLLERMLNISNQLIDNNPANVNELALTLPDETGPAKPTLNVPAAKLPIHQLIGLSAKHNANRIAVECGDNQLSYAALEQQSNRIANWLISQGVDKGDRVGILMSRRVELISTLLGTIKAGACYIPMDPAYPDDRLAYMLEDAAAKVLITESCQQDRIQTGAAQLLDIDQLPADTSADAPNVVIKPDDAIYMIYTSGSTGLPKGAQVYHQGESNLIDWYTREYAMGKDDAALVISASGFDLTQKNYFALLTTGGRVVLPDTDHFDANRTIELVAQHKITMINCAPSAFYPLVEDTASANGPAILADNLRLVLFGGETIQLKRLRDWIQQPSYSADIINMYGPTECTDIATAYRLEHTHAWSILEQSLDTDHQQDIEIPLGTASQGVHLYVLNDQNQPVPEGLAGELCIAGISVGAGYWQKPELTAKAFIDNPFATGDKDKTLYRTGDLVRFDNGQLVYVGRKDFQVKLRGLRIELGEIEQAILALDGIEDCRVLVDNDQLLAFAITPNGKAVALEYWREALTQQLPDYMVPKALIAMANWPLTPNGKVDRVALLALERPSQQVAFVAPRTDLEKDLATLWQEVLGVGDVGVHENFFESGGDSLKAVRLIARIELRFEVKLPVASLFGAQTIAQLAHVIDNQVSEWSPIVPIQPQGDKTPIFAVHALGAMVLSYEPLARALGKDQPLYGIQAYGFEEDQTPFTNLDEMVSFYVEAIKKQQPEGPYQLIGHSFGGLVAVEIAHRLLAAGDKVTYLGLLDTHMPIKYVNIPLDDAFILKTFAEHNFGVVDIPLNALRVMKPENMIKKVAERFNGVVSEDFIHSAISVIRGFQRMMMNYKPKAIDLPVELYRPEVRDQGIVHKVRKLIKRDKAELLGWDKVASKVEMIEVEGDHYSMLNIEHVDTIAKHLTNRDTESQDS